MSKLLLTYFFGFDLKHEIPLPLESGNSEYLKTLISTTLYPDSVKRNEREKSLTFINKLVPRTLGYREQYFVYQIRSVLFDSEPTKLKVHYEVDMSTKIASFLSALVIILCSGFLTLQLFSELSEKLSTYNFKVVIALLVCLISKILVAYFLHDEIMWHSYKLDELAQKSSLPFGEV